ncbi:MAG: cation:dicarboxylate symporter family transporter, partial [Flavobacteriales bacterium]
MSKSNKLTVWIFVALVLGVLAGAALNAKYPALPAKSYEVAIADVTKALEQEEGTGSLKDKLHQISEDSTATTKQRWEQIASTITSEKKKTAFAERAAKAASREEVMNPALKNILEIISIFTDIFLRLIKMIIAPLVFSTLVVGVAKLGDLKAVGRIGGKTM